MTGTQFFIKMVEIYPALPRLIRWRAPVQTQIARLWAAWRPELPASSFLWLAAWLGSWVLLWLVLLLLCL